MELTNNDMCIIIISNINRQHFQTIIFLFHFYTRYIYPKILCSGSSLMIFPFSCRSKKFSECLRFWWMYDKKGGMSSSLHKHCRQLYLWVPLDWIWNGCRQQDLSRWTFVYCVHSNLNTLVLFQKVTVKFCFIVFFWLESALNFHLYDSISIVCVLLSSAYMGLIVLHVWQDYMFNCLHVRITSNLHCTGLECLEMQV